MGNGQIQAMLPSRGPSLAGKALLWTPPQVPRRPAREGASYLSEREDDIAAAVFLAGKADVTICGEHPPDGVTTTEGRPKGTVHDRVQLLLPRQPEERPEELILGSGFQVPGKGRRENQKRQER